MKTRILSVLMICCLLLSAIPVLSMVVQGASVTIGADENYIVVEDDFSDASNPVGWVLGGDSRIEDGVLKMSRADASGSSTLDFDLSKYEFEGKWYISFKAGVIPKAGSTGRDYPLNYQFGFGDGARRIYGNFRGDGIFPVSTATSGAIDATPRGFGAKEGFTDGDMYEYLFEIDGKDSFIFYRRHYSVTEWTQMMQKKAVWHTGNMKGIKLGAVAGHQITIDDFKVYTGSYAKVTQPVISQGAVDVDGGFFFGAPDSTETRSVDQLTVLYDKENGYTKKVLVSNHSNLKAAKTHSLAATLLAEEANPETTTAAAMVWESVESGAPLAAVKDSVNRNNAQDSLEGGDAPYVDYSTNLNEVRLQGYIGAGKQLTAILSEKATGNLVAAVQTKANEAGFVDTTLGIDPAVCASGNYALKVWYAGESLSSQVSLYTNDILGGGITTSADMKAFLLNYGAEDIRALAKEEGFAEEVFARYQELAGANVGATDLYAFREYLDPAVEEVGGERVFLLNLNQMIGSQAAWTDIRTLLTVTYKDILGLTEEDMAQIRAVSDQEALFSSLSGTYNEKEAVVSDLQTIIGRLLVAQKGIDANFIVFEDDFSDNSNGWLLSGPAEIKNGRLYLATTEDTAEEGTGDARLSIPAYTTSGNWYVSFKLKTASNGGGSNGDSLFFAQMGPGTNQTGRLYYRLRRGTGDIYISDNMAPAAANEGLAGNRSFSGGNKADWNQNQIYEYLIAFRPITLSDGKTYECYDMYRRYVDEAGAPLSEWFQMNDWREAYWHSGNLGNGNIFHFTGGGVANLGVDTYIDDLRMYQGSYAKISEPVIGQNKVTVGGKFLFGSPLTVEKRSFDQVTALYDKKYGYTKKVVTTSYVDVEPNELTNLSATISMTGANPETDTAASMLWDSVETGVPLTAAKDMVDRNTADEEESKETEVRLDYKTNFNEVNISGYLGLDEEYVTASLTEEATGKLAAVVQAKNNVAGKVDTKLAIDPAQWASGTYELRIQYGNAPATTQQVTLYTNDILNDGVDNGEELKMFLQNHASEDVQNRANDERFVKKVFARYQELAGENASASDLNAFREYLDIAIEENVFIYTFNDMMGDANTVWTDVRSLLTVAYKDILGLTQDDMNQIREVTDQEALFSSFSGTYADIESVLFDLRTIVGRLLVVQKGMENNFTVFEDDFSDFSNGWILSGSAKIQGGKLYLGDNDSTEEEGDGVARLDMSGYNISGNWYVSFKLRATDAPERTDRSDSILNFQFGGGSNQTGRIYINFRRAGVLVPWESGVPDGAKEIAGQSFTDRIISGWTTENIYEYLISFRSIEYDGKLYECYDIFRRRLGEDDQPITDWELANNMREVYWHVTGSRKGFFFSRPSSEAGGVTWIDDVRLYQGVYTSLTEPVIESGNAVTDGTFAYGYKNIGPKRKFTKLTAVYDKKYGYTKQVVTNTYTATGGEWIQMPQSLPADAETDTAASMLWDSVETGVPLTAAKDMVDRNTADEEESKETEVKLDYKTNFNEVNISGYLGLDEEYVTASLTEEATGKLAAVVQAKNNVAGKVDTKLAIDPAQWASGTYELRIQYGNAPATTQQVTLYTNDILNDGVDNGEELKTFLQNYASEEFKIYDDDLVEEVYQKYVERAGANANTTNLCIFREYLKTVISQVTRRGAFLDELNQKIKEQRWFDIHRLITETYKDIMSLSDEDLKRIHSVEGQEQLFLSLMGFYESVEQARADLFATVDARLVAEKGIFGEMSISKPERIEDKVNVSITLKRDNVDEEKAFHVSGIVYVGIYNKMGFLKGLVSVPETMLKADGTATDVSLTLDGVTLEVGDYLKAFFWSAKNNVAISNMATSKIKE